jgi:hypothetical protein
MSGYLRALGLLGYNLVKFSPKVILPEGIGRDALNSVLQLSPVAGNLVSGERVDWVARFGWHGLAGPNAFDVSGVWEDRAPAMAVHGR